MEILLLVAGGVIGLIIVGWLAIYTVCFRKVQQGQALVKNGAGGTSVSFSGKLIYPVFHKVEYMDISVTRLEINRRGQQGLICRDNIRADISVAFFVRVNKTEQDVLRVAQTIGCVRASDRTAIAELFEAKFSEALKTVGRQFDFVELYNSREKFREQILRIIGTDLNGYVLDDAAIDYLEQTPLEFLNPNNILDAEGIKKITELTAVQAKLANHIARDREKVIKKQDVETEEAILELNRQLAEATEKQKREVLAIKAREDAEAIKIQQENKLKSEQARIATEEEVAIAEENKNRQIIVAQKNKERTHAVETERVEKDRLLEVTERERVVTLADIEKTKVIEIEQKKIQDVIRERVMVEKAVVIEKEKIKDTEAFAAADRQKQVVLTKAAMEAEEGLVKEIKAAEASKKAAELKADEDMYRTVKGAEASKKAAEIHAEEVVLTAEAHQQSAERESTAKKRMAEAVVAETAAPGLGEAQVLEARAVATEKQGTADARVLEAKAVAAEKQGTAEAKVMELKFAAEAQGITEKAEAMKIFDGVGREHEEFKLRLYKERDVELASINIQKDIASSQAMVVAEALKNAKVDIVGGDHVFFDKIVGAITAGKSVDRVIDNSQSLTTVRDTFFNSDPEYFREQFKGFTSQFGLTSEDLKNLSVSAALAQMISLADNSETKGALERLLNAAKRFGVQDEKVAKVAASKTA
ncbi:MAG: flotillin family protein [Verrucomicrobiota bacterium]